MQLRNRINSRRSWHIPMGFLLVLLLGACSGSGPQSALEPLGPIARDIDSLWDLVFYLATAVFIFVMVLLLIAIVRYRERPGDASEPKQIHGSTVIELSGVVFSVVLLSIISVPTVRGLLELRTIPTGPDVIQVQVTGHQWWWEFEYIDLVGGEATLITANELHIPEDTKVHLAMTSADVIHSFWVPPLNGKRDVVPGRTTDLTMIADDPTPPGEPLVGQCAEFCGLSHADMRIKLHVHTDEDFEAWVDAQLKPAPEPVADTLAGAGWDTFNALCTACHQASVVDASGQITTVGPEIELDVDGRVYRSSYGPNLTHLFSRGTIGSGTIQLTTDHLSRWIDDPSSLKPMNPEYNDLTEGRILGMPTLGLTEAEIVEVVAMLETWR